MKTRVASLLDVVQTVAIVVGLGYGALQLFQFRSEQRQQAKIEMARSFLSPGLLGAFVFVMGLPDSVSYETLEAAYPTELPNVILMGQTFETIGILVHDGDIAKRGG